MEASKKPKDGRAMPLTTKIFKQKPRQDLSTLHKAKIFFSIYQTSYAKQIKMHLLMSLQNQLTMRNVTIAYNHNAGIQFE